MGTHIITPFCLVYLLMGNYPSASQKRNIVVQLLNHIWLFVAPWTEAHQTTPLPFTISQSLLKLISIESVVLSNHLIVCHPLLLLPPSFSAWGSFSVSQIFASGGHSIGVSASTSVLPINVQGWFSLGLSYLISLLSRGLSRVFSSTTIQIVK